MNFLVVAAPVFVYTIGHFLKNRNSKIAPARLSTKDQETMKPDICRFSVLATLSVGTVAAYGPGNPPPWWLVHLGEMLAAFVMLVLGSMLAFIIYTEQQEQKEREEKYKRRKKNDEINDDDDSDDEDDGGSLRRRRDAGSKSNPM